MINRFFAAITTIDEANKAVRNAAVLAVISGLLTVLLIFAAGNAGGGPDTSAHFNFIDAVLLFTLAYLLYFHKSRTASVALLLYYILGRIVMLVGTGVAGFGSSIWLTIIIIYVFYRGIQGAFSYSRLNDRPVLPWKLIVRNIFVLVFWMAFSFYLAAFAAGVILGMLPVFSSFTADANGYEIAVTVIACIILPLISILGAFNRLPGVTKDLKKDPFKIKVAMFQNMFCFGFDRSFTEAAGFYIVYLMFIIMSFTLAISALSLFGFQNGNTAIIIAFICCLAISCIITFKKGFYKNPLYILLAIAGVIASIYGGAMTGLLVLAYLTTLPAIDGLSEEKIYERHKWYHGSFAVICVIVLSLASSFTIARMLETGTVYENIVESPYAYLARIFYSEKDKIYLKAANPEGLGIVTYKGQGIRRALRSSGDIANYYGKVTVAITTYDKNARRIGMGSGFIISPNGFIVTNYHVMSGAYSAKVILSDGDEYNDVYYLDEFLGQGVDACVIKINAFDLAPAMIGDARESAVGEEIFTIGNPMEMYGSISDGIISGFRNIGDITLMQITAPISPGSSGGPVVNRYGEVIGISTLASQSGQYQNINFAVPINFILNGE